MCDECTEQAWEMSAEDERERIIKLLEAEPCDTKAGHPYECICEGLAYAIALIKGEKK